MRPAELSSVVLCLVLLGCAVDMGAGGGAMAKTGHAVAFGRLAASTRPFVSPIDDRGVLFGVAVEGRGEERVGSRFDAGVMVGYTFPSYSLFNLFAPEFLLEGGTPLRASLFEHRDSYFGFAAGLPFPLYARRDVQDLNRSTWIMKYRVEFMPFARVLLHNRHDERSELDRQTEISGGLIIRHRLKSDLF